MSTFHTGNAVVVNSKLQWNVMDHQLVILDHSDTTRVTIPITEVDDLLESFETGRSIYHDSLAFFTYVANDGTWVVDRQANTRVKIPQEDIPMAIAELNRDESSVLLQSSEVRVTYDTDGPRNGFYFTDNLDDEFVWVPEEYVQKALNLNLGDEFTFWTDEDTARVNVSQMSATLGLEVTFPGEDEGRRSVYIDNADLDEARRFVGWEPRGTFANAVFEEHPVVVSREGDEIVVVDTGDNEIVRFPVEFTGDLINVMRNSGATFENDHVIFENEDQDEVRIESATDYTVVCVLESSFRDLENFLLTLVEGDEVDEGPKTFAELVDEFTHIGYALGFPGDVTGQAIVSYAKENGIEIPPLEKLTQSLSGASPELQQAASELLVEEASDQLVAMLESKGVRVRQGYGDPGDENDSPLRFGQHDIPMHVWEPSLTPGKLVHSEPHLPDDATARKDIPIASGVLDYFPDALIAIAEVSKMGNDQHNPGKPLHWDRSKSGDESDALLRHLVDRGKLDTDGKRHSAKVAWRALALLQKEIEESR